MTVYIYGLWDCDYNLRYIGKTSNLDKRLYHHIWNAKNGKKGHTNNWIRQLLNEDLEPQLEILEECTEDNWAESEKSWIKECREKGLKLTNVTDGGEGVSGYIPTKEHRQKTSKSNTGRRHSQETRKKIGESQKGKKKNWNPSQEYRDAISKRMIGNTYTLGFKHTEESKRLMSENSKGQIVSEKTRRKLSIINKGRKATKETREKMSIARKGSIPWNVGISHKESTRKKISLNNKMYQANKRNDIELLKKLQREYLNIYGFYNDKYRGIPNEL